MSMLLLLRTCLCSHVNICVCKTPKYLSVSQIIMSLLPISSRPGSGSVVSEPPVPVLGTTISSGTPVPVLGTCSSCMDLLFLCSLEWTSSSCAVYDASRW